MLNNCPRGGHSSTSGEACVVAPVLVLSDAGPFLFCGCPSAALSCERAESANFTPPSEGLAGAHQPHLDLRGGQLPIANTWPRGLILRGLSLIELIKRRRSGKRSPPDDRGSLKQGSKPSSERNGGGQRGTRRGELKGPFSWPLAGVLATGCSLPIDGPRHIDVTQARHILTCFRPPRGHDRLCLGGHQQSCARARC